MSQLTSVPVLWYVVVTFLNSFILLSPSGKFWIVQLLHSVSDMTCLTYTLTPMCESFAVESDKTHIFTTQN